VTFEKRLARLEAIAAELEGDDVELARALALFEEGIENLRAASEELSKAEARVQRLVERADGTFDTVDARE
jgi:exodeoxyribonuclease VII small subunit